jgi:hypothetical protein
MTNIAMTSTRCLSENAISAFKRMYPRSKLDYWR